MQYRVRREVCIHSCFGFIAQLLTFLNVVLVSQCQEDKNRQSLIQSSHFGVSKDHIKKKNVLLSVTNLSSDPACNFCSKDKSTLKNVINKCSL